MLFSGIVSGFNWYWKCAYHTFHGFILLTLLLVGVYYIITFMIILYRSIMLMSFRLWKKLSYSIDIDRELCMIAFAPMHISLSNPNPPLLNHFELYELLNIEYGASPDWIFLSKSCNWNDGITILMGHKLWPYVPYSWSKFSWETCCLLNIIYPNFWSAPIQRLTDAYFQLSD